MTLTCSIWTHNCRYDSLVSGGLLLLEFQEWCTYRKKRCLVPIFKENYAKIKERNCSA
jgi:hypothetical protein